MSNTTTRRAHDDFPCIDGLRGFAAVAVLLCHTAGASSLISSTPGDYLAALRAGVQVFFVISGFVLYRPFAQAHQSGLRGPRFGGYFRRRFLRIFPAYWVVLTVGVYALGVIYLVGTRATITNYLLVQSYFPDVFSGLGPAWTLVVEVSFYVFLPFYALAVWWLGRRRPLTTELCGCGVLLLVGVASFAWYAYGGAPPIVSVLPANLAPFALGMAMAVARTAIKPQTKPWYWSERAFGTPWKAWLLAAIAFSATVWAIHYPAVLTLAPVNGSTQMGYELLIDVMGLFVVLPAVFGNQLRGAGRRVLRAAPVFFIGTISYGIYLWHVPIMDATTKFNLFGIGHSGATEHVNFFSITVVTLVLTVAVATASWFLLEKPLIRFSHRPRLLQQTISKWLHAGSRWRGAGVSEAGAAVSEAGAGVSEAGAAVSEEAVTPLESATAD